MPAKLPALMNNARAHEEYATSTYERRFDSWTDALEAAGHSPNTYATRFGSWSKALQEAFEHTTTTIFPGN